MAITAEQSREFLPGSGSRNELRILGANVHNLRKLNLVLPLGKWISICGVSGSGKTSLALDTIYAAGQRRYIESFSTSARQFLEKLDPPDVESITGLPLAIAVTAREYSSHSRASVGSATELDDYFQLLFAKLATPYCARCEHVVQRYHPESAAQILAGIATERRMMILVAMNWPDDAQQRAEQLQRWREQGYLRLLVNSDILTLDDPTATQKLLDLPETITALHLIVDRLSTGSAHAKRQREALEAAWRLQPQGCVAWFAGEEALTLDAAISVPYVIKQEPGHWLEFPADYRCTTCQQQFPLPQPKLFNFNTPLGACAECQGFGNRLDWDMNLIVPDRRKSIRDGAIAPWNTPAYAHELDELLALAEEYKLPVDVPFSELTAEHIALIQNGVPERKFGGLLGFQAWLERRKYKLPIRVFMSRWRSSSQCLSCHGTRWNNLARAYRVGERDLAAWSRLPLVDLLTALNELSLTGAQAAAAKMILDQLRHKLRYLIEVGLDYLTLDRPLSTLSTGEAQRISLTAALGSSLVNVLYVLDEPTLGLHVSEIPRMITAVQALRDRGNTVLAVEHEEQMLRAADNLVEIGPGAGERGGNVVFQGTPKELIRNPVTATGGYLIGERYQPQARTARSTQQGWLRLAGARGHHLQNLTVDLPLGVLTVVCGVSASGKTTLVEGTLYRALCQRKKIEAEAPLPYEQLSGERSIEDVILIDSTPIGRSPRSNPATYMKIWDDIRKLFAETPEAKTRNYGPGHFSFNVADGRCDACEGDGYQQIDMQFMSDVYRKCPTCNGKRFKPEILRVEYRARSIADMLELTVREAFTFFRGAPHLQSKLKQLIDVGLEYLRLGQPANTLSAGESQRLKLAGYIASLKKSRTLFILDEPTSGLHFADVAQLLECFQALLDVGHTLIVADHHPLMLQAADYLVELGPGPAAAGGRIIATGTPSELATKATPTGQALKKWRKKGS
jgi:excinuclease ABC subunit A